MRSQAISNFVYPEDMFYEIYRMRQFISKSGLYFVKSFMYKKDMYNNKYMSKRWKYE